VTKRFSFIAAMFLLIGLLAACGETVPNSRTQGNDFTEDNQARLEKVVPAPALQDSVERRNLVRRLNTFNSPDKIAYVYLMSGYGDCIAFFTIKGKTSSVNSQLNPPDREITHNISGSAATSAVVQSPDLDGSYNTNGNGIFTFLDSGAYMETNLEYIVMDQPLKVNCKTQVDQTSGPTNSGPVAPAASPVAVPSASPSPSPSAAPTATPKR
jgi:hypothetical protein